MIRYTHFQFCPKCGSRKIEKMGENGIRCRRCAYLYYHNCAAAASALLKMPGGKILLIRRDSAPKRGYYDLPGGFVEYGESFETALAREIREELRVEITGLRYFASVPNRYPFQGVTYFSTEVCFLCRPLHPRRIQCGEEVSGIAVVEPEKVDLRTIAFPSARTLIRKYRSTS